MEIQALRVRVTEPDLAVLSRRILRDQDQLSDVQIRITTDGFVITGTVRLLARMAFETRWNIGVEQGKLVVTLRELRAGGFAAGMLIGVLMSMIQAELERQCGMAVEHQTIVVNPDEVLADDGLSLRTNLIRVECENGALTFISEVAAGSESQAA
jgi:hypothetical protein